MSKCQSAAWLPRANSLINYLKFWRWSLPLHITYGLDQDSCASIRMHVGSFCFLLVPRDLLNSVVQLQVQFQVPLFFGDLGYWSCCGLLSLSLLSLPPYYSYIDPHPLRLRDGTPPNGDGSYRTQWRQFSSTSDENMIWQSVHAYVFKRSRLEHFALNQRWCTKSDWLNRLHLKEYHHISRHTLEGSSKRLYRQFSENQLF